MFNLQSRGYLLYPNIGCYPSFIRTLQFESHKSWHIVGHGPPWSRSANGESKSLQGSKVKCCGGLESKPMSVVKTPSKGEDKHISISKLNCYIYIISQNYPEPTKLMKLELGLTLFILILSNQRQTITGIIYR